MHRNVVQDSGRMQHHRGSLVRKWKEISRRRKDEGWPSDGEYVWCESNAAELKSVPFVIDPFAIKGVDAVLATHYHQDHMSAEYAAHVIKSGMMTTDENGKEIPGSVYRAEKIRRALGEMGSSGRPVYYGETGRQHQD